MKEKILSFVNKYNFEKRLKSINYKIPVQFLKENKNITLHRSVI